MNRISFLNRGYAFKGLLAVWVQQCDMWTFTSDNLKVDMPGTRARWFLNISAFI